MEVEEIPTPGCKFPRIHNGNSRTDSGKIGKKRDDQHPKEEEAEGEANRANGSICAGVGIGLDITTPGGLGRLCGWPSSRIVRVSRASGGKDRHSKVWTSKGLRDRRVRLSVNSAIEFYHLQDRLGYDQPSKAVEWLLKAAASSIAELPAINTSFPDTPQQLSEEKRSSAGTEHGFDSTEVEMEGELFEQQQQQHGCSYFSKSACSSTSETSKGPGLSVSRSESRIKARVRARERAAEKEKKEHQNVNLISQSSSFTELLTGGMNNSSNVSNNNSSSNNNTTSPNNGNNGNPNESNFFQKSPRQWSSTPMDYFATGLLSSSSTCATNPSSTSFLGQIHLGNHLHHSLSAVSSPLFTVAGEHHQELQHFSFVSNHLVPVVTAGGGGGNGHANSNGSGNGSDCNLNFTISPSSSSGIAGFNRGTLQSNSSSPFLFPYQVRRFSTIDGPSAFFTTSASPPNNTVAPVDNHHHQFLSGFDARLQLCHGDEGHHSGQKRKAKN